MMAWSIENYYIVLASRVLDGILGGNVSLAQAYVSGRACVRAAWLARAS